MDYISFSRITAKIISFEKCLDVRDILFEFDYGGFSTLQI